MIRIHADDELLDIPTESFSVAQRMARAVRPRALVLSDTRSGRYELYDYADTDLYTRDTVAHWTHPGETGRIIETEVPRSQPRFHWVEWPGGFEPVAYFAHCLIRVTKTGGA